MLIIVIIFLCALSFWLGWAVRPARPAEWKTIEVDPTGKGPNVDPFHYEIETDEGVFRFTDHEKNRGRVRAPGTHNYHAEL